MIARMWHGYTTPENADAYEAMLKPEVLPGVGRSQGYRGSYFLRRNLGTEVEFVTAMLWESLDAIRAFAGPNYEVAIVPPERRRVLKRFDEKSAHYEIVSHP
jgi:heme-degrading monooxygenase HmoA